MVLDHLPGESRELLCDGGGRFVSSLLSEVGVASHIGHEKRSQLCRRSRRLQSLGGLTTLIDSERRVFATHACLELCTVLLRQPKGVSQQLDSLLSGRMLLPPLQCPNGAHAQSGSFGKFFLSQVGMVTVVTEQLRECGRVSLHDLPEVVV